MQAGTVAAAGLRATRCALLAAETIGALRTGRARPDPVELMRDAAVAALALHQVRVTVVGQWPRAPAVIVANHVSWIDPLVLLALGPAVPLAKREVLAWPVVGPMARRLGAVFVRRSDPHSGAVALRCLARALCAGQTVLGFPEGTTSAAGPLPFRRGLFGLARMARVPVVPVALAWGDARAAWVGDAHFVPHWLSLCGGPPMCVEVRVGRALLPGASPEALADEARGQVTALLASRGCP